MDDSEREEALRRRVDAALSDMDADIRWRVRFALRVLLAVATALLLVGAY